MSSSHPARTAITELVPNTPTANNLNLDDGMSPKGLLDRRLVVLSGSQKMGERPERLSNFGQGVDKRGYREYSY